MDKEKQNKLVILVGDSGCGKTELMKLVFQNHSEKYSAIKKSSTREARPGEENAIEIKPGCSIQEVDAMDYVYIGHNGNKYGFMKEQIEEQFIQGKSPMVIVDSEKLQIKVDLLDHKTYENINQIIEKNKGNNNDKTKSSKK